MGPIELADTVGLDICLSVAEILSSHLGGTIPETLQDRVSTGNLGKKSGRGFFEYKKGKAIKPKQDKNQRIPEDIQDRLIFRLLNECVACLNEGVVEDMDQLDAGIIFGTGFAPFRGGPMHFNNARGLGDQIKRLEFLEQTYGERFKKNE
jgi:3-hydroxyacyl-CoA dehydrogenase/enoyl-CoA hydratase/3-hydroxybutyryl-CoA epimerase